MEETGLWKEIVESRYRSWKDMKVSMEDKKSSVWWRDIWKICDVRNGQNWFTVVLDGNWVMEDL